MNKWATDHDFKFSLSIIQCVHFCSQRKMHNNPVIKFKENEIPVLDQDKFLGVIFDKKTLTFTLHIKYLKTKCTRDRQLLRVLAHTEWGADWQMLLKVYRSLIRKIVRKALSKENSIFTDEIRARDLTLNIISESNHKIFLVFCFTITKKLKKKPKKTL